MPSDLDIYRSAKLLSGQHGADAEIYAATRADEMLAKGSLAGRATWMRIAKAIREMTSVSEDELPN